MYLILLNIIKIINNKISKKYYCYNIYYVKLKYEFIPIV